ncbi:MAG: sensor histidine kinase, partial [Myxococcota bacterium]
MDPVVEVLEDAQGEADYPDLETTGWQQDPSERRGSALMRLLRQQGIDRLPPEDPEGYERERFTTRARTLFYARLAFLTLGLGVLAIPGWSETFGIHSLWAFAVYFCMVSYSALNFLVIEHPKAGRAVTFVTLCLDLLVMVYMIAASGGLRSPLLATQLLFTLLFVILFPKPLAIIPPLLTLPVMAKIDQLLHGPGVGVIDLFILLWYSAINFIVVYVMVYLNERESSQHRDLISLQTGLREMAVVEERNRLAREIHDGLGASLSSLIIQCEYLENLAKSPSQEGLSEIVDEIREMKTVAEESIDELRRNVSMMRKDFDLVPALEDYCRTFESRSRIRAEFEHDGRPPDLSPDVQLTIFRVLQESLTNVVRHAGTGSVSVRLSWRDPMLKLIVSDEGAGFDAAQSQSCHYGLTNMKERARSIGGEVLVES